MFTKDSRILNHRLIVPLTSVSNAVGDVFKPKTSLFDRIIPSLFANNEQGFVYDQNDLSTMYQDSVGTVPVTAVGQPVGLVLDKSKGMVVGDELVVDGDFSSQSNWSVTGSWSIDGGFAVGSNIAANNIFQTIPTEIGKMYVVSGDVLTITSGSIRLLGDRTNIPVLSVTVPSQLKYVVIAKSQSMDIGFRAVGGFTGTVDNVSVKELLGNHAYQATSSMRPLLVASPQRLDFDTVDDKLITNLSAQLTGCTVIRSVPNVGTQILTGRTIPTTYNDNTDHCGLIVINRALTPAETSVITTEFNKRAGV